MSPLNFIKNGAASFIQGTGIAAISLVALASSVSAGELSAGEIREIAKSFYPNIGVQVSHVKNGRELDFSIRQAISRFRNPNLIETLNDLLEDSRRHRVADFQKRGPMVAYGGDTHKVTDSNVTSRVEALVFFPDVEKLFTKSSYQMIKLLYPSSNAQEIFERIVVSHEISHISGPSILKSVRKTLSLNTVLSSTESSLVRESSADLISILNIMRVDKGDAAKRLMVLATYRASMQTNLDAAHDTSRALYGLMLPDVFEAACELMESGSIGRAELIASQIIKSTGIDVEGSKSFDDVGDFEDFVAARRKIGLVDIMKGNPDLSSSINEFYSSVIIPLENAPDVYAPNVYAQYLKSRGSKSGPT